MKMIHSAIAAVFASAMAFAPVSQAADGTITFNGKVIAQTCQVTTGTGGDFTVTLPVVQTSDFKAAGDTAGAKDFNINLANCPTNPSGVKVATSFSGSNINSSGRLTNTGSAKKIDIALFNQGSTAPINITNDNQADGNWESIAGNGTASLKYTAKYFATAAAVDAGAVTTTVDYTLIYQ